MRDGHLPQLPQHLSVQVVSSMVGVKVSTLNRWRQKGRGPSGWVRLSKTHGVYEAEAVLRWLDEKKKGFRECPGV
jgi:hypothetical protein